MEEAEKIRQLAIREKPLGMMGIFNGEFYEVQPYGVQCKPSTFLPCEHFSKIYVIQNALGGDLRGHMGATGQQLSVDCGLKLYRV